MIDSSYLSPSAITFNFILFLSQAFRRVMVARRQSFSVHDEAPHDQFRRASGTTGYLNNYNLNSGMGMDSIITQSTYANTSYRDGLDSQDLGYDQKKVVGLQERIPFKITRLRRTWEKVLAGFLILTLILIITKPHKLLKRTNHFNFGNDVSRPTRHTTPLPSFRDNLRKDLGYVTSFPYGGLTNQLIEVFKLVHLGKRLDRVAIIPDLNPIHSEHATIPLTNFFDLKPFATHSKVSVIEWADLKMSPLTTKRWNEVENEILGCWGWQRPENQNKGVRWTPLGRYKVEVGFWPPPGQLTVPAFYSSSFSFPSIEVLASSDQEPYLNGLPKNLIPQIPITGEMTVAPKPEDQLLCFSNLFYVPASKFLKGSVKSRYTIEEFAPTDPVWSGVGKYLHFNQRANDITTEVLQYFYHLQTGKNYHPPSTRSASKTFEFDLDISPDGSGEKKRAELGTRFIGIHLRQGDFIEMGRSQFSLLDYQNLVEILKIRLYKLLHPKSYLTKKVKSFGSSLSSSASNSSAEKQDLPVFFVTDSSDRNFIQSVQKLGWIYIDHDKFRTLEKMKKREAAEGLLTAGGWYTGIIDSVILSRSIGLVGTKQSTFSYVSARRVESWSGGLALIVGDDVPLLATKSVVVEERISRKGGKHLKY